MKRLTTRILAGAVALAAAGSALADMSLAPGTSGDGSIFLNVIDATNQTSFAFDTGLKVNEFNGGVGHDFSSVLASDPNWATFISGVSGNDLSSGAVTYDVVGVNTVQTTNFVLDATSNASAGAGPGALGSTSNSQLKGVTAVNSFINAVDQTPSSTTDSLFASNATTPAAYAGTKLSLGTQTASNPVTVGTTLGFYNWVLNGTVTSAKATVSAFAGTWDLTSAGTFAYTVASSTVPLPPSLMLLLSGIVLTALIARRRSSTGSALAAV